MKITLSPKLDFLRNTKLASAHQDVMASPAFQHAASVALLEMQLAMAKDPQMASVAAIKLQGAQAFLDILLNVGEPKVPTGTPRDDAALTRPEDFEAEAHRLAEASGKGKQPLK